jgi:hypothetical protein
METATIKAKLAQQLAWMEQEPLYQVFVNLRKAYDHLDFKHCLALMTGYGVGPILLCLPAKFWDQVQLVCCTGGSFGKLCEAFRGQQTSLMFNVCVDAVIREWLWRMLSKEAAHGRFEKECRETVAFFVNDQLVRSSNPIWLQSTLDVLVILFESIGLRISPDKKKVMTCIPENICVAHTKEVYHTQQKGPVNPTAKHHQVECDICGASLAAGLLQSNLKMQHNTYRSFVLNLELNNKREAVVYQATANATGTYFFPVLACVEVAGSKVIL